MLVQGDSSARPLVEAPQSRPLLFSTQKGRFRPLAGQWIESVTDWAIRITDWGLFPDWVSSHARLADPIRPMPNKGKSGHSGLPIALISRLPDWVVQSVLPIAIHRLLHRLYPLASAPDIIPLYNNVGSVEAKVCGDY